MPTTLAGQEASPPIAIPEYASKPPMETMTPTGSISSTSSSLSSSESIPQSTMPTPQVSPPLQPQDRPRSSSSASNLSLDDQEPNFVLKTADAKELISHEKLKSSNTALVFIASAAGKTLPGSTPKEWQPSLTQNYLRFAQRQGYETWFSDSAWNMRWNGMRQFHAPTPALALNPAEPVYRELKKKAESTYEFLLDKMQINLLAPNEKDVAKWESLKALMSRHSIILPATIQEAAPPNPQKPGKDRAERLNLKRSLFLFRNFIDYHFPAFASTKLTADSEILNQAVSQEILEKALALLSENGMSKAEAYSILAVYQEHAADINSHWMVAWNEPWNAKDSNSLTKGEYIIAIAKQAATWQVLYVAFLYTLMAIYARLTSLHYQSSFDLPLDKISAFGPEKSWETFVHSPEYEAAAEIYMRTLREQEAVMLYFLDHLKVSVTKFKGTECYRDSIKQVDSSREEELKAAYEFFTILYVMQETIAAIGVANHINQQGKIACFAYPKPWTDKEGKKYGGMCGYFDVLDPKGEQAQFLVIEPNPAAPKPSKRRDSAASSSASAPPPALARQSPPGSSNALLAAPRPESPPELPPGIPLFADDDEMRLLQIANDGATGLAPGNYIFYEPKVDKRTKATVPNKKSPMLVVVADNSTASITPGMYFANPLIPSAPPPAAQPKLGPDN